MLKAIVMAVVVGLPAVLLYGSRRWHTRTQELRARLEAVARGELMRFFAESAWYPTALLPSQGVRWGSVDNHSAKATLIDGTLSLTVLFRFGVDDFIESVQAEARGRTVGGRVIPTPWEGRFSSYQEQSGMHVPLRGEVAWLPGEGHRSYRRGQITRLVYDFARSDAVHAG